MADYRPLNRTLSDYGAQFPVRSREAYDKMVQRESQPRITYDGSIKLMTWLKENRPEVLTADSVAWLAVRRSGHRERTAEQLRRVDERLEAVRHWPPEDLMCGRILNVAREMDFVGGAWQFFVRPADVKRAWKTVAWMVWKDLENQSPVFTEARVSPRRVVPPLPPGTPQPSTRQREREASHVIMVFNADFADHHQVAAAEAALRQNVIFEKLYYKPEVMARLGVYADNGLLSPSIYTSIYSRQTKQSRIEPPIGYKFPDKIRTEETY